MNIQHLCSELDTAFRVLKSIQKLDGKIPEGEDPRKFLSEKDLRDFNRMSNQHLGGGFVSHPHYSTFAEWRARPRSDANCTEDPSNSKD